MPELHLVRPLWLIALVPLIVLTVLISRRARPETQWRHVIALHLLRYLIVRPQMRWGISPVYLVATGLALGILALSGPAWRRELPPFVEDKGALMIALAVTPSMTRTDVAPSRLERAKQKIRDLLAARAGAHTGLIAYAGSAHLVMPLTDDRSVIEPFLAALAPALMPAGGNNVVAAITLAADALASEPVAGTILVVADDIGAVAWARQAAGRNSVVVLAIAPPGEAATAPDLVRVSADGADIRALARRIETHFQAAQSDRFGSRWQDEGYWLLLPAALASLLWFRRGTTIAWVVLFCLMLHAPPAHAQGTSRDLWLTRDQQGRIAFDKGDYAAAARLFADPMWRGIAAYRAYDFLAAAAAFRSVDTAEGRFALGNAEAQNHAYEKAIAAYDAVLKAQPDHAAAKTNRAIVLGALRRQEEQREKQEQGQTPPELPPDDTKVDPNQKGGQRVQVTPQDVTTAGAAEAWMRAVQTSPADFLKLKFAIQAATAAPRTP
jgi:Ca-activated chloride channel family protein